MALERLRLPLTAVLCLVFFGAVNVPHASAVACATGAAAQNNITVSPSHGPVFYVDTGNSPVLDAGYVGYRVTNSTGSTKDDLWVQLSSFTGGQLGLANALDTHMKLPTLTNGSTGTSYFLLKALAATTSAQVHTVKVYERRPDLSSATLLYTCDFTFSKIKETIKAAANKVSNNGLTSAAAIEVSDTTPEYGQLINITVEGVTGQIGAGSTPDFDIIWLSPAAVSTWPTRALRLESVSALFDGNGNWSNSGDQVTYSNQLLISSANGLTNVDGADYRITYSFRVIGSLGSAVQAVPMAMIASGTQIKHSDTGATGGTLSISFTTPTINVSVSKNVTSSSGLTTVTCGPSCSITGGVNGTTYAAVPYRITASSTSATTSTVDEFVDTSSTSVIFKPGSATITDIGRTSATIADPIYISSESALNPRPIHFIGPFNLSSATSAVLDYQMWVPVGTFLNTAYARIGDTTIGASPSAMSQVSVTSDGSGNVVVSTSTVSLGVVAITEPATSITTTGATIQGTVDPNGTTPLTGTFEYGTSSTLSGATTVTATTPGSGTLGGLTDPTATSFTLTGLTSGTTYYYRAIAGSAQGSIMSFTTQSVLANPTATTTAATSIGTTTGTLNGTINPNLTPVTGILFVYGTASDLTGASSKAVDDGTGLAALTAGGSSTQPFSYDLTGLTTGTTYYYKIRACTSALSGTYPNHTCTTGFDGSIMSFVPAGAPVVTTNAATSINPTDATLNGTVNATGASTTTSFTYSTVSDLSSGTTVVAAQNATGTGNTSTSAVITGLSASTTYYFRASATNSYGTVNGSILNFTTGAAGATARTLAIDSGSYTSTYVFSTTPPTITSTASAGVGTKTYSSSTTGVCTVNATSGVVTFVSTGTCTIGATIATDGTYAAATASDISFSITTASRTISIDGASYASSYVDTATPPTLTSTASAGTGTKTYTSSTTGVCTVNASSGLVAFVAPGTCTISVSIAANGGYGAATSSNISFTITSASAGGGSQTPTPSNASVTINAGASCTATTAVTLTLQAYNASQYLVADNQYLIGAAWQGYSGNSMTVPWTLGSGDGTKSVYVMYKNGNAQSGVVSDSITLDAATNCGSPVTPPTTTPTVPVTPTTPGAPGTSTQPGNTSTPVISAPTTTPVVPIPCTADCANVTYDLYIVNPNGTERHIADTRYVRTERVSATLNRFFFEDSGNDFDYNDVVLEVNRTDCTKITVTAIAVDARWEHNVRLTLLYKGKAIRDLLIWPDSHQGIGQYAYVNANEGDAVCKGTPLALEIKLPEQPPYRDPKTYTEKDEIVSLRPRTEVVAQCAEQIICDDVGYDLYIINPDGTERHMDTKYAAISSLPDGRIRVGFEDSGRDFDHNDVVAIIDKRDCADVRVEVLGVDAGWHHRMVLDVFHKGARKFDAMIWSDTHAAGGTVKSVDAKNNPAMCADGVQNDAAEPSGSNACSVATPFVGTLLPGTAGAAVTRLQNLLSCLGYLPANVTARGVLGRVTQNAVIAFQQANGIDPLGVVGPRTRSALNEYVR